MLSTSGIQYNIGKKSILSDIQADFAPGSFNMILGPNGSGKSSFLKIFSGEKDHFKGMVSYDGVNIRKIKKEELARRRAVMSQEPELNFPLQVDEVVMMGRYPHFSFRPGQKDESICDAVMNRLDLTQLKYRNYLTLSGGEKKRVQFARVLAQVWERPVAGNRYLFLDEPLASLDIKYQQGFLQVARELAQEGMVLVAVMHDLNLAIQYADKLFFLKEGRSVAQGAPGEIIHESLIEEVYGVRARVIKNPDNGKPLVVYSNP